MRHEEGTFPGIRNNKIFYQSWLPDQQPRAVLLIMPGLTDHSGRYMNVVNHFVPLGYAVTGMDSPGHGKSEGEPLYAEKFTDYTGSLETFVRLTCGKFPNKPMFLFGHSMGGLISAVYLIDHQEDFAGAILCAPVIHNSSNNAAVRFFGGMLQSVAPRFGLFTLDRRISRDPEWIKTAFADPLYCAKKIPARTGYSVLMGMLRVRKEAGKIKLPILILQGTSDYLLIPEGAKWLYEWVSSPDKKIIQYDGYYHELFNEPEAERVIVLDDITLWLESHLRQ